MKRRDVHVGFATLVVALAAVLGWQLWQLRAAAAEARALAAMPAALTADGAAAHEPPRAMPRARLAWAGALAAGGEPEMAEASLSELAARHGDDAIGHAARFALANRYLREGLADDIDPRRAAPLIELAKQGYRDLLRVRPDDWDARYNLERALRAAPEGEDAGIEDERDPVKSVDVVVPDFVPKDLP